MKPIVLVSTLALLIFAIALPVYADLPTYGPDGIAATPVSTTEIDLTWNAVIANPSVTGYKIERESSIGSGFTTIVANTNSGNPSYADTNLSPNTSYNYRITAINADGLGLPSANAAIATTLAPTYLALPDTPQGLTVTPISAASVSISWIAPPSTENITGYNIDRNVSGGFSPLATGITATNYTDINLSPGGYYGYRVTAVNSVTVSPPSPEVFVTMPTLPNPPTNVSATASDSQAIIRWSPAFVSSGGITGYIVTGMPDGSANATGSATSATITGLTNGLTYWFSVVAMNVAGTSSAAISNSVQPTTSTPASVAGTPVAPTLPAPSTPTSAPAPSGTKSPSFSGAFYFSTALAVGSRSAAVTALQNYLTAKNLYTGPVTGYFGALTRAAVIAYQRAHALPQVGSVGPLTRGYLNAGL